jgi:hypothetical protein
MTRKQQDSSQIAHDNKNKLQIKRQKEPRKVVEEASGCVRPERVSKWPNSVTISYIMMMMMMMMMVLCTTLQYFLTLIHPNNDPYIRN